MPSWSDGCYWDVTACRWVPCGRPVEANVGETVADRLPSPRDSALPPAAGSHAASSPAGRPASVPAPGADR